MSVNPGDIPSRAANIFVNYRREDSAGHSGRLFDRLSNRFPGRVFMDIDTIEPGVDFVEVIKKAVGCCEVLIVVIGREWLNLKDAAGRRRLDDPEDFVRLEVAAALERNIRVIPVLVEDAPMPRPEALPPELAKLARRNAIELSDARWAFDVDRLIKTIEGIIQESRPALPMPSPPAPSLPPAPVPPVPDTAKPRARMAALACLAVVVLALAGWIGWRSAGASAPEKTDEMVSLPSPGESTVNPVESSEASSAVPVGTVDSGGSPEDPSAEEETPGPAPDVSTAEPEPQPLPYGPDTCKQGFVWREARPEDHVCVTQEIREQTVLDNQQADARRDPAGGPYGAATCLSGYVWREAFDGDTVCVPPETRDQARLDNEHVKERRMRSVVRLTKSLFKSRSR
ncbi:MAG TPA: toll/interleukin-1 receptor domain-containing protein [Thermoanaerobaculia bacterium]|nr:toll/interleukin-1 receptor domain-containing protein [Thermoanaerobaculia bacterium]